MQKTLILITLTFLIISCEKEDDGVKDLGSFYLSKDYKNKLPYTTQGEKLTFRAGNGNEISLIVSISQIMEEHEYDPKTTYSDEIGKCNYKYEKLSFTLKNDSTEFYYCWYSNPFLENNVVKSYDSFYFSLYFNYNSHSFSTELDENAGYYKNNQLLPFAYFYKSINLKGNSYSLVYYTAEYKDVSETIGGNNYMVVKKVCDAYMSASKGLVAFRVPKDTSLYILVENKN